MKQMRPGFTMVEMIIVIGVIGFILTMSLKFLTPLNTSSGVLKLSSQLSAVESSLNNYRGDMGTYPGNIRFLFQDPNKVLQAFDGTDLKSNYDIFTALDGGLQNVDVLSHWNGPYLADSESVPGVPDSLKANFGQAITIGATITPDGIVTPYKPDQGVADGADVFFNVLVITGLEAEQMLATYQKVNGLSIDGQKRIAGTGANFSDARQVALGEATHKVGIPKYVAGQPLYLIYRYTSDFTNQAR